MLALTAPAPALAQKGKKDKPTLVEKESKEEPDSIYSWVDGRGAWHFVDSLALVPFRFKAQARANAMRATRSKTPRAKLANRAAAAPPPPPAKHTPATARAMTDGERTMRIRQLQRRLGELEGEIAALEEGNVPESYLKAAGSEEALTDAKLDELLGKTEGELSDVESELAQLQGQ